jgi:diguanylate cyclase (GGDEF)-like protein
MSAFTTTGSFRAAPGDAPPEQQIARTSLRGALDNAIQYARLSQRFVALLMVKLDRPDRLDALLGIPTADVMEEALKRLAGGLRHVDRYVRLSDEKLCVMLPNLKMPEQAWLAAGKVQQMLEAPFVFGDNTSNVRPVIGIACYPDHAANSSELIINADIARRIARSRDVAQHVFQNENRRETDVYAGLETALKDAIRANQLQVHYQPQVNCADGCCPAVEALLRWDLAGRGAISPPAIVRVAEVNGMIGALTAWVLNTALRHQSEWRAQGFDLSVSVNLSTLNLADADLPDLIGQAMGTWQSDPARITLEITESSTIDDAEHSLKILERFKEMGLNLAVDDFGTGYSSLSYVKRFPLDELKIDKLFVQHMRDSKGDQQIVRSVIDLAHNFEMKVVAEGVEDDATFRELKKLGCDLAQGYVISKAMPLDDLKRWLGKRTR